MILFCVKPIGTSSKLSTVYNKQEQIGVYEYDEETFRGTLLEIIDVDGNKIKESRTVSFLDYIYQEVKLSRPGKYKIYKSKPSPHELVYFDNLNDAVIEKLLMLKGIQSFFDIELTKIKEKVMSNLPQNLDKRLATLPKQYT